MLLGVVVVFFEKFLHRKYLVTFRGLGKRDMELMAVRKVQKFIFIFCFKIFFKLLYYVLSKLQNIVFKRTMFLSFRLFFLFLSFSTTIDRPLKKTFSPRSFLFLLMSTTTLDLETIYEYGIGRRIIIYNQRVVISADSWHGITELIYLLKFEMM